MATTNKIELRVIAYWFAFLLLFVVLGQYGRDVIEWVLIKLYEILIQ